MSDEIVSGTPVPAARPAAGGAYDWLFESHQQSAPMAPLTDDIPAPSVTAPTFRLPDPAGRPEQAAPFPDLLAPVSAAPAPIPVQPAPVPLAPAAGLSAFTLERRHTPARSGNGPLDWIAFVLACLAPPIGLVLGIVAVIVDSRTKGYAAGIAKAAIGIGVALTLVLGVAIAVVTKLNNDQAAHASIVASSSTWCTKLKSNPAALSSDTFGWPSPGDTIPASIAAMKSYQAYWAGLAKVAPGGIRGDTQKVADTAASIVATVQSTQTLNDAGDVAQMQNVVATSGIHNWVSSYCG